MGAALSQDDTPPPPAKSRAGSPSSTLVESAIPRVLGHVRSARPYASDALLVILLGLLTLFARWMTLEPIENGGDPLDNWYFVRQWAHDLDWSDVRFDHHASRFGIHFLTFAAQKLFGVHPEAYYVPQLFASVVSTMLIYLLARQVAGKAVGVVAALFLVESNSFICLRNCVRQFVTTIVKRM